MNSQMSVCLLICPCVCALYCRVTHFTCNCCLTNETELDCISICALISPVVNEGCVFVQAERETPVFAQRKGTSPTRRMIYPFSCCSFLSPHCFSEIKTKRKPWYHRIRFQSKHSESYESRGRKACGVREVYRKCIKNNGDNRMHTHHRQRRGEGYVFR